MGLPVALARRKPRLGYIFRTQSLRLTDMSAEKASLPRELHEMELFQFDYGGISPGVFMRGENLPGSPPFSEVWGDTSGGIPGRCGRALFLLIVAQKMYMNFMLRTKESSHIWTNAYIKPVHMHTYR